MEHNNSLCCTWSFLGYRAGITFYRDAIIRDVLEKDCLHRVRKDVERWPEDTRKAAEANLRRVEENEATFTSD